MEQANVEQADEGLSYLARRYASCPSERKGKIAIMLLHFCYFFAFDFSGRGAAFFGGDFGAGDVTDFAIVGKNSFKNIRFGIFINRFTFLSIPI